MNINSSYPSINEMNSAHNSFEQSANKISTGDKIYEARFDPSGLSISERMDSIVSGTLKEIEGVQNEISMNQVAEGGLTTVTDSLQRIYELGVQAKDGTLNAQDRSTIQNEVNQLTEHITYTSNSTEYNTQRVLSASMLTDLGIEGIDVTDPDFNLDVIKDAISDVTGQRSKLGAKNNAMASQINTLHQQHYSTVESYSGIRDVDLASEVIEMTKHQMKEQVNIQMINKQKNLMVERTRVLLGN